MIPKIIHYCWFGKGNLSALEQNCIASWKKHCPDYQIILWNEENFDVNYCDFTAEAYRLGKYAFVSDVARLYALRQEGGVYLDTDMLLLKNLDYLLLSSFFTGEYKNKALNAAIIGSMANSQIIEKLLNHYKTLSFDFQKPITIPEVFEHFLFDEMQATIYPPEYFYPLPFENKTDDYNSYLTEKSFAVHLWNHSWKDELNFLNDFRFIKAFYTYVINNIRYKNEYKGTNRRNLFFSKFKIKFKSYIYQLIFDSKKK